MTRVPHGGDLGFRVERPDGKGADPVPAPRSPPAAGHRDDDGPPDVPGDRHVALVVRRPADWLEAHGYTTILPRDLAEHWDRGVPLPARCVILTFDDGYPEWVSTVLPLLDAEDDPVAICSCHSFLFRPLCSMEVLPVEGVHATGPQT